MGGVDDFLREYGLSTREGLALMVLAEALLRVPDALTQDRLDRRQAQGRRLERSRDHGDTWFVSASAWALGMSARVIKPGETPEGVMRGLVKRMGMPTVRTRTRQAMRFLGHHFVLGETIGDALNVPPRTRRAATAIPTTCWARGRDTALTPSAISSPMPMPSRPSASPRTRCAAGRKLPDRPGISVKLSALHPRYLATHRDQVLAGTGAGPGQAGADGQGA
jgi:RHH-type proline utilization regulon transcriptional repressor/proline dehydrogenase/delta 1-pyrroline-5-carboxylate dehydrogenase